MLKIGNIQPGRFMDQKADHVRKVLKMSKEEAVQLLTAAGYKAKVENSVVIARVENFTKKEFEKVRKILKDAGYNSSFGIKESKREEKNVQDEESAET